MWPGLQALAHTLPYDLALTGDQIVQAHTVDVHLIGADDPQLIALVVGIRRQAVEEEERAALLLRGAAALLHPLVHRVEERVRARRRLRPGCA